ncbi:MAG TPA: hypothetical protein VK688_12065 [Gemmatimonadales bacterium]|nr:hypothetical protein [Gemmatimonadales bacterium]
MGEAVQSPITAWDNFYVIVGSSAGALTGLQFVVMALIAEAPMRSTTREVGAFGTPTIVHFCAALLVSAILSAPWSTLSNPAIGIGIPGAAGVAYIALVAFRAQFQSSYRPVLEDWVWHTILPLIAYGAVLGGALTLVHHAEAALFIVAAAALLLVYIGIHNAWDTVIYIALQRAQRSEGPPA